VTAVLEAQLRGIRVDVASEQQAEQPSADDEPISLAVESEATGPLALIA
jgi:hypothetical protein